MTTGQAVVVMFVASGLTVLAWRYSQYRRKVARIRSIVEESLDRHFGKGV